MLSSALFPIETDRLLIRCIAATDLPALLDVHGDDEVNRYLPYETWTIPEDGHAWFEGMMALQAGGGAVQLVIVLRESALVIGTCVLFEFDMPSARGEIGYVLGRRYWGSGYMAEALEALVTFAFEKIHFRRLEATIDPRNIASARLLEQHGFVSEGTRRQRTLMKGCLVDSKLYGCLAADWHAFRAGSGKPVA